MENRLALNFCPYKGLQPYTEQDREFFFGRERDQEIVTSNLFATTLTIFYGASGVGKSSVLMAGVVPQLRAMPRTAVVLFRTWQDAKFLSALKKQTLDAIASSVGKPVPVDTNLPFDDFVGECAAALHGRILFIFDQFEEYFLYHPTNNAESSFDAEFARAVNRREVAANFLISLREDSLSRLDRFKGRIPNLLSNMLRLEHLDRESTANAMRGPVEAYNRHLELGQSPMQIEDALVNAVIDQVRIGGVRLETRGVGEVRTVNALDDVRVETPYLQLVMTRLWDEERRAGSNTLRLETFKRLGGAQQIVRTHLDKTLNRLADSERQIAARAFRYLVTPSRTKIAYTADDLASYAQVPAARLAPVLQKLAAPDVRVLRSVASVGENQPPMYEIFHDVLTPAVLDWRDRYIEQKRTRTLQMVGAIVAAAFVFVILTSFVAQWNTRTTVSQEAQATAVIVAQATAAQVVQATVAQQAQVAQATIAQQAQVAQTQVRAEQQQAQVAQTSVADLQQSAQQQSATQTVVAKLNANAAATQDAVVQIAAATAQAQAAQAATVAAISQSVLRATPPPPSSPGATSTPEPTLVSGRQTVAAVNTSVAQSIKFAVEEVRVSVSPESSARCPTAFTATATIRVNQAGTVTYRGEFDDGTNLPLGTVTFADAGTKTVTYSWSLDYPDSGSIKIRILSPNSITSNSARWQVLASFYPSWLQNRLSKSTQANSLGCPRGNSVSLALVREPFEKGMMLWREDNKQIYALILANTDQKQSVSTNIWKTYADTWDEKQSPSISLTPPRGLYEPVRGFGKVWREQLGEPKSQVIGWATAPEVMGKMQLQNFENGFVILDDRNDMRILFSDGKWTLP